MNTTQNAIDANFSQNYFVKLGQLLAVLTVAQKNETRWSMYITGIVVIVDPSFSNSFFFIVLNLKLQTWFLRYTVTDQLNFVINISRHQFEMASESLCW